MSATRERRSKMMNEINNVHAGINKENSRQHFHPEQIDKSRYLLFPILHHSQPEERGQDHWSLLVLDRFRVEWKFYNSMRPRKGVTDHYIADATELKEAVDRTKKKYNLDLPNDDDEKIMSVSDVPQQKPGTVDCGVIVLYLVKCIFEQQPITKIKAEKEIPKMRKEIAEALLEWGSRGEYCKKKK